MIKFDLNLTNLGPRQAPFHPLMAVYIGLYREKLDISHILNVFHMYLIHYLHKVKKFVTTLKKLENVSSIRVLKFCSNFHSMQNNEQMRRIYIFFVASCVYLAILLVRTYFVPLVIPDRLHYSVKPKKFYFSGTRASKWANLPIFGQN